MILSVAYKRAASVPNSGVGKPDDPAGRGDNTGSEIDQIRIVR